MAILVDYRCRSCAARFEQWVSRPAPHRLIGTVALSDRAIRAGSHLPVQKPHGRAGNARFVMVLRGDCGACFAALSRAEDALWLNATVPFVGNRCR